MSISGSVPYKVGRSMSVSTTFKDLELINDRALDQSKEYGAWVRVIAVKAKDTRYELSNLVRIVKNLSIILEEWEAI